MGTNAYYGYIDVISDTNISRYYLILLPEENTLFQFVLMINDTTIDYETNLEAINILTSVYKDENAETDDNNEEEQNTIENNIEDTNDVDSNTNSVDDEDSNTISDDTDDNATTENTTSDNEVYENVANSSSDLSDILN